MNCLWSRVATGRVKLDQQLFSHKEHQMKMEYVHIHVCLAMINGLGIQSPADESFKPPT